MADPPGRREVELGDGVRLVLMGQLRPSIRAERLRRNESIRGALRERCRANGVTPSTGAPTRAASLESM
ncbi:MAG: hypothetical protein GKR94_34310 [Gammaproteobacteria bacterium]|nr:hypothetical protein [Gammaproteobacteria bacterium]